MLTDLITAFVEECILNEITYSKYLDLYFDDSEVMDYNGDKTSDTWKHNAINSFA